MPNWPPAPGKRTLTFELALPLVQHLDHMAARRGCSRAAYLRLLILQDLDDKTPVSTAA